MSNLLPFATARVSNLGPAKTRHIVFGVVPPSTNSVSGKYLIAYVDVGRQVPESNEENNVLIFQLGPDTPGTVAAKAFHKAVRDHRTRQRQASRAVVR
jgi:hypothetical protein